jgi:protein-S-isoprenylcysteine O-methyltransferase Ste14
LAEKLSRLSPVGHRDDQSHVLQALPAAEIIQTKKPYTIPENEARLTMSLDWMTADTASEWASRLWMLLGAVWLLLRFGTKRAKQRETPAEFALHVLPVIGGFWLLFARSGNWGWLNWRLTPYLPPVWTAGLLVTLAGVGMAIWARLTLGSNWSSAVTLKNDHVLIRNGLYRWIRHPIYTGILLGMIGSAMIRGHLRGWIGLVVVLAAFYFKARREERFLREEFGAGFDEHSQRTGMFLPKWT